MKRQGPQPPLAGRIAGSGESRLQVLLAIALAKQLIERNEPVLLCKFGSIDDIEREDLRGLLTRFELLTQPPVIGAGAASLSR
jgi:hypothetical protein